MAGDERDKCSGGSDEYFAKSPGQRALIVIMGPVVNICLAYLCFCFVFMIGFPDMERSSQQAPAVVGFVAQGSPAQSAGLKTDDKTIAVDGNPINHWGDLLKAISTSTATSLALSVERQGQEISLSVKPDDKDHQDFLGHHHKTRKIGVGSKPFDNAKDILITRYGFFEAFGKAGQELWDITLKTYGALFSVVIGAISPREAFGGPISIFFVIQSAITIGFTCVVYIVGFISASLGIFNLLPIIPLDGGHLFLIALEKLRGKSLSVKTDQWVIKTGFVLILTLMLFVIYSDFDRFGLFNKILNLFKGTRF